MKRVLLLLPIVMLSVSLVSFGQLVAPGTDSTPKVGEKAPEIEKLKEFAGKKVLLAFFPAAFTGG